MTARRHNQQTTLRILTFTTLYPNNTHPHHGIFVENRLRHLIATGEVVAHVVAPVPWFPWRGRHFGSYGLYADVKKADQRNNIYIEHPRYLVIPMIGMLMGPYALYLATSSLLQRFLSRSNFDLIDAHYFYPDGVAAVMLGAALNKPVVITARGTDVNLIPSNPIARRQIQYAAQRAAGIIAVSDALKQALISLGVEPQRIEVLRNGVDLDTFYPENRDASRTALSLTGPTLLSVGHLIERKGHDIAIEAMTRLPDYTLLIVGDGPEQARLASFAESLGVANRVRLLGAIPHEELRRIYEAADALVLASSREGWPNVLLESMACGTPVIASALWGNPEVVSKPEAGVLMQSRSPDGVAAAVKELFSRLPSRHETRAFAAKHSWRETSQGQIDLFRRVIASRPTASVRNE